MQVITGFCLPICFHFRSLKINWSEVKEIKQLPTFERKGIFWAFFTVVTQYIPACPAYRNWVPHSAK